MAKTDINEQMSARNGNFSARELADQYARILNIAAWLFAAVGLIVVAPLLLVHPKDHAIDYNYLWAAGKLWLSFESPYTSQLNAFLVENKIDQFPNNVPFFYPPNSFALLVPFAAVGYVESLYLFSLLNVLAIGLSSYYFGKILAQLGVSRTVLYPALIHIGLIGFGWNAGRVILANSAHALIFYSAFVTLLYAAMHRKTTLTAFALIITLMKPQLGVPLCLACLFIQSSRPAAVVAIAVTGVLGVLGLVPGGVIASAADFLDNLSRYDEFFGNRPQNMSGLDFFVHAATGVSLSKFIYLGLCCAFVLISARLIKNNQRANDLFALLIVACIASVFFLPSHNNYYVVLTPLIPWLIYERAPKAALLAALIGVVAIARSWSLAAIIHPSSVNPLVGYVAIIDSIAILLIFAVVVFMVSKDSIRLAQPEAIAHER